MFITNIKQQLTGSLQDQFNKSVSTRINSTSTKELFSLQDHVNRKYVKSTTCWAKSVDLTCCSPYNYSGGQKQAGTLITPQHIITASHYGLGVGSVLRFLTKDLTIIESRVISAAVIPNSDIFVSKLENPLPSIIKPTMLLPKDAVEKIGTCYGLPILTLDQEEKALVSHINSINSNGFVTTSKPISEVELNLYEDKISGDSGNPMFLLYGDNPILISHLRYGGSGAGPSYVYYYQQIVDTIAYLGGANFINVFDIDLASSGSAYLSRDLSFSTATKILEIVEKPIQINTQNISIQPS